MYKELQTKRLNIRPITLADSDFIIKLVNSDGWIRFIGDRNIKEKSDSERYIQKILDNNNFFYSVFELKDTRQAAGIVTFLNRDEYEHPDIGFALLPEFEKKGFAFEAVRKYLDELLQLPSLEKIIGITIPQNFKSIKLLERLGFKFAKTVMENKEELALYELAID